VVSQCKNWCLAEGQGNGDQRCPMGRTAAEGLYVFTLPLCRLCDTVQTQIMNVCDTNHVADFHDMCPQQVRDKNFDADFPRVL